MSTLGTDPQAGSGRIVVGVDGSSHSEEALRWAIGQARVTGQSVEAVTSWSIPVPYGGMGGAGAIAAFDWEGDATRTLKNVVAEAVDSPDADRLSQRVVMGHPAQVLLDAAADAALLVSAAAAAAASRECCSARSASTSSPAPPARSSSSVPPLTHWSDRAAGTSSACSAPSAGTAATLVAGSGSRAGALDGGEAEAQRGALALEGVVGAGGQ